MHEIARLGFVLVGLSFLQSGVWSFVSVFASAGDGIESELAFATGLVSAILFGIVAGGYLIRSNRSLAMRLFPDAGPAPELSNLVTAVFCVFGAYLVIRGAAGLLGFVVLAFMAAGSSSDGFVGTILMARLATGASHLGVVGLGALLLFRPRRVQAWISAHAD